MQKESGSCLCFFDPCCKLLRRRQASRAVVGTIEVGLLLLLLLIERRSVQCPRAALYQLAWESPVGIEIYWGVVVWFAAGLGLFLLPHLHQG